MEIKIIKYYYGDIPEEKSGGTASSPSTGGGQGEAAWPLWEVFIRSKQGLDHKHVGSLHAADAQSKMPGMCIPAVWKASVFG
jgi:ring-1,2-phenylacetyl-CoA epoxidase subunit PaaB